MEFSSRVQRHRTGRFALVLACLLALAGSVSAQVPESNYQDLHWRLVGPFRGGWATAVAGVPGDPDTYYFGAADGGVWKTVNSGSTWTPLFNHYGSASIGALAIAPSNPKVIWVGTGQIHQRWDIVSGDGVYRSTDGGANWTHLGLRDSKHIGAIWVDPRDADTAIVAALGHVFGANQTRGLFRTSDGGQHWQKVLFLNADTGAADLAADPALPDLLYASLWQVRRHPWLDYFQPTVGAGSALYKSTDGGRHWSALGSQGLPEGPLGRIELAVARNTQGRRVWAGVQTADGGGLYRSDDGGQSWRRVNDDASLASSYTSGVFADPQDADTVWAVGQPLRRSTDGGAHFTIVRSSPGGDDYHDFWIDPSNPQRMITGADQGAVISADGGQSWSSWYNQPTGQFYRLAVDNQFPYRIYSGQQDSGTVSIASRSDYGQITFRDWHPVGGDERDGDVPDPGDPNIVYGAGLGGRISRWDARTGQVQNVSPWPVSSYAARPGSTRYRYDWITPLAISQRKPYALYAGAQVLFRSLDHGQSWQTISADLTGAMPDARNCNGEVPLDRTSACGYGTIVAISPSPAADHLVWVGSDNGRVQLTRDDGKTWRDVTPPGMADWSKVNLIDASRSDPATAYVAVDRHRLDDDQPMAFRTHDYGAHWTEIGHGLPSGAWVGVVRQDPRQPGLLYAGTSRGVHVSFDDGAHWQSLQLDLPTTGINDLLVHDSDLIVGTQGRAIWILDDVVPLRALASGDIGQAPVLIKPLKALRLRWNQNHDTPLPPEEPRGENPPTGAVIDYILPTSAKGKVSLEISDAEGNIVRRFASDQVPMKRKARIYFAKLWLGDAPRPESGPGQHRFVWDLRLPPPDTLASSYSIAAIPGKPTPILPRGAYVLPGNYQLTLEFEGKRLTQPLHVAMDPRVETSMADLKALASFQAGVVQTLQRAVDLSRARSQTQAHIDQRLADKPGDATVKSTAEALTKIAADGPTSSTWVAGVLTALAQDLESVDAAPTQAQIELLSLSRQRLGDYARHWKAFTDTVPKRLQGLLARVEHG